MRKEVRVVPPYNQRDDLACLPRLVLLMFFVAIIAVVIWIVLKFMNVCKLWLLFPRYNALIIVHLRNRKTLALAGVFSWENKLPVHSYPHATPSRSYSCLSFHVLRHILLILPQSMYTSFLSS
jgi:hypothetical protein